MQVIPAINSTSFEEARNQIEKASRILGASNDRWVHLDVADGKFTRAILWDEPEKFNDLQLICNGLGLSVEAHLMVEEPQNLIENWFRIGIRRVVVHVEAIKDLADFSRFWGSDKLVIASNSETPVEKILEYIAKFNRFLFLAVSPGWAGQVFNPLVLEKIKILRERMPDAIIEVDGGINEDSARKCKEAGANIVVSASYLFMNTDGLTPDEAYQKLIKI